MKNGFGLMHLHKFLSIPFLQLQVGSPSLPFLNKPFRLLSLTTGLFPPNSLFPSLPPFPSLQQETLLQQLQVNREQMLSAMEELDAARVSEDQNYGL